jgi:hypothetical protein
MAYEEICPKCGAVMVLNAVAMKKRLESMATHLITGVNPKPNKAKKTDWDETFEVECVVKRRTEKAILIEVEDMDDDLWIPISQIEDWDPKIPNNKIDSIFIPLWLAIEKKLSE